MKTIPPHATDILLEYDGQHTVLTYMNQMRANTHIFIGEYKIIGNKVERV